MKQALKKLKEEEESQEEKETLQFKQSRSAKPLGHRKVLTPFLVCFYNNLVLIKLLLFFFLKHVLHHYHTQVRLRPNLKDSECI